MNTTTIARKLLFALVFICTGQSWLWAQIPNFKIHDPFRKKVQVKVQCAIQLRTGTMWFGTSTGLISYDGNQYKSYTTADKLADNSVTALCEGSGDTVWVGHNSGAISIYTHGKFQLFNPDEGLPAVAVTDMIIDRQNTLWFSTYGEGIYYYKNKRVFNLNSEEGLNDDFVYCLAEDRNGKIWSGTDGGIGIISIQGTKEQVEKLTTTEQLPDNIVRRIITDGRDNLWIGMQDGGICRYDLSEKKFILPKTTSKWSSGAVTALAISRAREIWIGTENKGILKYTETPAGTDSYRLYNMANGFEHENITMLYKDMEGSLWIGTNRQLLQCPATQLEYLEQRHGLISENILATYADRAGNLWLSSDKGVMRVSFLPDGTRQVKTYLTQSQFASQRIVTLYEDDFGYIWLGTYGNGVHRLDPATGQFKTFGQAEGLAYKDVLSITGKGKTLWFGTLGGGVSRVELNEAERGNLSGVTFKNYTEKDGLGNNYVYDVHIDNRGNTWFGTDGGGLTMLQASGTFRNYKQDKELKSAVIYSITEDKNGDIWFSTSNAGIYKFDLSTQSFKNFNEQNGLREQAISSLTADEYNNVIIVYQSGLIDILNVSTGRFSYLGDETSTTYREASFNAVTTDNQNNIWIGTNKGVIRLETRPREAPIQYPTARINSVRVFLRDLENPQQTVFKHNQHHFTFDVAGMWLQAPEKVMYQYRMDNFDMDWSVPTQNRTITYSNLPPGHYTFRVRAAIGNAFDKASEATYTFEIETPIWQRPWFYGLAAVVLGALIYLLVRWRIKRLEMAKIELEQKVNERTAQILQQKHEIEAQRDEIEAQRDNIEEKSATLERALREIERKNQDITSSIFYARRIQRAILPSEDYIQQVLKNIFILYKPRDIVSGDFYWMAEKDDKIYVAVADCTGHGVPGAFMSMIGTSLLNEIIADDNSLSPADILQQLHTGVKRSLRQEDGLSVERSRDGMDIALCAIDIRRKEIEFAGAKRPLYIARTPGELEELKGDKFPIGGIQSAADVAFTNYKAQVEPGSTVYMFTDGYADQFGGDDNRKYMVRNFRDKLLKISNHDLELQKRVLEEEITTWKGHKPQTDDILVLGFRL